MARAVWKGAINFGLVTIPVKLYLATESKGISFNMLHSTCLTRIQMKTFCPFHEETIQRGDTVKGYEYAPGQYVVVTEDDLESVPLKTVRAIEIEAFIDTRADDTPPRFVKQAYYLEPDTIGRKAFFLLKSVLADLGRTAICKIVLREREQLAALDPFGKTLLLSTLYWPDEVRALGELELPEDEVQFKPAERLMAEQLVESLTEPFDPAAFRDEYRGALMQVIEAKVSGQEVAVPEAAEPAGQLVDLMKVLEASVAAARQKRASPTVLGDAVEDKAAAAEAKTTASVGDESEEGASTSRPARRRKTA